MTVTYGTYRKFHTTRLQTIRFRLLGLQTVNRSKITSKPEFGQPINLQSRLDSNFILTKAEAEPLIEPVTKLISNTALRWAVKLVLLLLIAGSMAAAAFLIIPKLYYEVAPVQTQVVLPIDSGTVQGGDFNQDLTQVTPGRKYAPPVDESLPEGEWLIIPRIGVHTELQKTEVSEEALAVGVWHVPEFGNAGDIDVPMILAAHRFGWDWWWKDEYWKYNSFYLLPDTQPGDRVEVIADKQKWIYEIYAGEEGDEISDYDADLILYTCKFLNSPVRHFRYAKLIDPTVDTQQISQRE